MSAEPAVNRMNVWMAVGMLIGRSGLLSTNALAMLRGYAFSHDTTLDDLSYAIINRDLNAGSVVGDIDAG